MYTARYIQIFKSCKNGEFTGPVDVTPYKMQFRVRIAFFGFQLHSMFSSDANNRDQIEKQVLDVWDKMYENWMARVRDRNFLF